MGSLPSRGVGFAAMVRGAFLGTEQGGCCEQKGAVTRDADLYGEGVGLGIRKEDAALRDKLNAGIKAMAAKGTFEQISAKWNLTGKLVLPTP
jgi:polar amino acid transport system substrate-binding protein